MRSRELLQDGRAQGRLSPRPRISFLAAAGIAMLILSCGDGAVEPQPPPAPLATTVTVHPGSAAMSALGETARFTAEVRDQNGQVMTGAAVAWASSDASVAAVDGSGQVTAVANGTATITATAGPASGTASVTVAQVVAAVAVSPAEATLSALGDTLRLAAEAFDANRRQVVDAEFSWESSDDAVATVDGSGLVTAAGSGTATIAASAGGTSGSGAVTVMQSPDSVAVSPAVDTIAPGDTVRLAAEVFDGNGYRMESTEPAWSSSDLSVARVDRSGLVTGVGEGVATITASAGSAWGSAAVTVMWTAVSVEVSPPAETIGLGGTLQLTAEGFDENGVKVEGVEFSWESSDASVATVDASGLVAGIGEGVATITASAGRLRGTAEVTVADLERVALTALYEATDGPNWINAENWLTDAPLGDWYGVDTDASGRVTRLDLSGRWDDEARRLVRHGLRGPIPPELGDLTSLRRLDLGTNDLKGPVPRELGRLANLTWLRLLENGLSGPIPSELGNLTNLTVLDLGYNRLSGPIPPALGSLLDLRHLSLAGNLLTGSVPPELGSFTGLQRLDLTGNELRGPIPESFLALDALERFHFAYNTDLCAPGTAEFVAWQGRIEHAWGPYCNESDMDVLVRLYQASGGPDWRYSRGWLEGPALDEWYGVTAGALGRVVTLDLTGNGLEGRLPADLGSLAEMTVLRVDDNALAGKLPLSLTRLSLVELDYANTGLCAPADVTFQTWLGGIASHVGTGRECAPPSEREVLTSIYEATDGPNWIHSRNWLTDAPLGDWYGVDTDGSGRVIALNLDHNILSGSIPPELGNLARLRQLSLVSNNLTGPIPPNLGDLTDLDVLSFAANALSGPIPSELAGMTAVTSLSLYGNGLSGPIPPEFGSLARMRWLELAGNDLTGPIPPELGTLPSLEWLYLAGNDLTGPIPSDIGNLTRMRVLDLASNNLTGPLPFELTRLSNLRQLSVANNPGLSGPIPAGLTSLRLERLLAGGTDLCAPSEPGFQAWLETVYHRRVSTCARAGGSMAYLTQAVQSRDHPVPLVAGRQGPAPSLRHRHASDDRHHPPCPGAVLPERNREACHRHCGDGDGDPH